MPDYISLFDPGDDLTMTASATILGGQFVEVTGVRTVGPTTGASSKWLGIACFDCPTGKSVTVISEGVQRVTAVAAVTAGDRLTTAANGQVTGLGAGTDFSQLVGIALTTAAAGATVDIRLTR